MSKMNDQPFFINVKDPVEVRKNLLEASKQVIQVLQRYERIKTIRMQKIEMISKLKTLNKEIDLLIAKLKNVLPTADLRVKVGKEENKAVKNKKEPAADELRNLEDELKIIEEKISKLS